MGPIFIPNKPLGLFLIILAPTTSAPELLNPSRLINALSSSNLNTRGFLFPYCFLGVIVPTSTNPNPSLNKEL